MAIQRNGNLNPVDPNITIIYSDNRRIRVLAGPGTGKTSRLIDRVARLLNNDIPPERIFLCTFTRTAADDITSKLNELNVQRANQIWKGTLHSFCFSILSEDEVMETTGRQPRPLLDFEQKFMLVDLQGGDYGNYYDTRRLLAGFIAYWALDANMEPGWPTEPIHRRFEQDLLDWLRFHRAMHIGELIKETYGYLVTNPELEILRRYEHVIVDEYQDLNRVEQNLLNLLAQDTNIFIAGDDNQAIYEFKHAYPEGISNYKDYYPDTEDAVLRICHRCPRRIISMANALIEHNGVEPERLAQIADENEDGEAHIVQWANMDEESNGLANYIHYKVANGEVQLGRILVLAPRRQFGYALRDRLLEIGVQAHSYFLEEELDGNPKEGGQNEAQKAFTLLTLLANKYDRVALRCWYGFDSSDLRKGLWDRIRQYCFNNAIGPFDVIEGLAEGRINIPNTWRYIQEYHARLSHHEENCLNLQGQGLVDYIFPQPEEWAQPLREISSNIEERDFNAIQLHKYLREAITQKALPMNVDFVRIMSLHKSKGLTADLVIIMGCLEGLMPFLDDADEARERRLKEQRRLFYVATTRARRILIYSSVLYIDFALARRMRAIVRAGLPGQPNTQSSTFLRELGAFAPHPVRGTRFMSEQIVL